MYHVEQFRIFAEDGCKRKRIGQTQAVIGQTTFAVYTEVVKLCKESTRCEGKFCGPDSGRIVCRKNTSTY
jgi:hypothetical protein